MSEAVSWLVSGLVGVLLVTFVWALWSLRHLPTERRPRTRTYDRLGHLLALTENPDYHENPGEAAEEGPDVRIEAALPPGGAAHP